MTRPPNDPKEPPITRRSALRVLSIGGAFTLSALLAFTMVGLLDLSGAGDEVQHARTVAFCTMVFSQLFFAFSARSQNLTIAKLGLFTNRKMIAAVAVSALLQLAVVYLPGLSDAFRTAQLDWEEWALILPLSMMTLVLNEIWKVAARRSRKV